MWNLLNGCGTPPIWPIQEDGVVQTQFQCMLHAKSPGHNTQIVGEDQTHKKQKK